MRRSSICPLHFGCSQTWRGTWPWCSPLCRWHPTVWPLFTCQFFWIGVSSSSSYWLNSRVDVLKPALSQHGQDTIYLAWYEAHSVAKRDADRLFSRLPSLTELSSMKNLGFIIDQESNMKDRITKLCQSCYYQLRQIRTVRHSLTSSAIQTLVHAFICTRVDFSNSLLYGTSTYLLDRLQSAAIQHDLRWLPVPFRIRHKLNFITSNCLLWQAVHRSTWSSYM